MWAVPLTTGCAKKKQQTESQASILFKCCAVACPIKAREACAAVPSLSSLFQGEQEVVAAVQKAMGMRQFCTALTAPIDCNHNTLAVGN